MRTPARLAPLALAAALATLPAAAQAPDAGAPLRASDAPRGALFPSGAPVRPPADTPVDAPTVARPVRRVAPKPVDVARRLPPLFRALQGQAVAVDVLDFRTLDKDLLPRAVEQTRAAVVSRLEATGVRVEPRAEARLVLHVEALSVEPAASGTQACARFRGRLVRQGREFLAQEAVAQRCVQDALALPAGVMAGTGGQASVDAVLDLLLGPDARPFADEHPGLARAWAVALEEALEKLDRQAR